LDGDAVLDVVTLAGFARSVAVLLGQSDGTFQTPLYYNTGRDSRSLAITDVDSDGRLDIVVNNAHQVSVLFGTCLP
ncbi:MAG TPA: VCBS repeat-containing protein, partial [Kofleriaceae bacterium]